ncbi:MAG: S8 family peptidase [Phocaeicola sp.]
MWNNSYRWFLLLLLSCLYAKAEADEVNYIYRIHLTDKKESPYSLEQPEQFLSERAIIRRNKQGLPLDETDLPVAPNYLKGIKELGVEVIQTSKWNNTALIKLCDTLIIDQLGTLPYVKGYKRVWKTPTTQESTPVNRKKEVTNEVTQFNSFYGIGEEQIFMHKGERLHESGFWGEGINIAVIDAGFYNVDVIDAFKKMNLLGVRDFVNPHSDIYAQNHHGMKVLSCLAAYLPNSFVGSAPKASYWLLRSEDEASEQLVEEDYWTAAIEFADSVGVDVVNTSLGYYVFDNEGDNYRYRDLDGASSMMSHTASMVAQKGMVLVCSAGNTGKTAWKKITPPADAHDVLSVGALNRLEGNADFSSVGNTTDQRIKPDIMAIGVNTTIIENDGTLAQANGTSFASPVICGLVACFWQACPWLTAHEVIAAIRQSGDRTDYPNNVFGYGIPNIWKAYKKATKERDKVERSPQTTTQNQ